MLPSLMGFAVKLNTLLDRWTQARAEAITNYLTHSTADLARISQGWDSALATKLDGLESGALRSRKITTAGSGTFTVPTGVGLLFVSLQGAGGGGGAGYRVDTPSGGSGGAIIRYPYAVTPASSISYYVGAGGAGGVSTDTFFGTGSDGEDTTFDSGLLWAPGGGGSTSTSNAGAAGTFISSSYTAIAAPYLHVIANGAAGKSTGSLPGTAVNPFYPGGAIDNSSNDAHGGAGSYFGAGGDGAYDSPGPAVAGHGGPGAGGGGASRFDLSSSATGGDGGDGLIIIEWVGPAYGS